MGPPEQSLVLKLGDSTGFTASFIFLSQKYLIEDVSLVILDTKQILFLKLSDLSVELQDLSPEIMLSRVFHTAH